MLSKKNAYEAVEIIFKQAVKGINKLDDTSRQCLYKEYKEWIENHDKKGEEQEAIIF